MCLRLLYQEENHSGDNSYLQNKQPLFIIHFLATLSELTVMPEAQPPFLSLAPFHTVSPFVKRIQKSAILTISLNHISLWTPMHT